MIKLLDTTLRDGLHNKNYPLDKNDKKEIVRLLDRSRIDIIEFAHITEGIDINEIIEIGNEIYHGEICILSDCDVENMETSARILEKFPDARIHLYSMANADESEYHQSVFGVSQAISFMSEYTKNIQWTGFDANRADFINYKDQIEIAIDSGARIISIADSFGISDPDSFKKLITRVKTEVVNIKSAQISVHCHDDLGYAFENSRIASDLGITQVECTVLGIGARKGNCNIRSFAEYLNTQNHNFDLENIREAEKILKSRCISI